MNLRFCFLGCHKTSKSNIQKTSNNDAKMPCHPQTDNAHRPNDSDAIKQIVQDSIRQELPTILEQSIVNAQHQLQQEQVEQHQQERQEWQAAIGYQDFKDSPPVTRRIETLANRVGIIFRLPFVKKDKIKGTRASETVLKTFCKDCVFLLWSVVWIWIVSLAVTLVKPFDSILDVLIAIAGLILTWIIWSISRMMRIEIEKMNSNAIMNFSAIILGVISIIVTVALNQG